VVVRLERVVVGVMRDRDGIGNGNENGDGEVLFWVLFMGAHCAYREAEEEFFLDAFGKCAARLGLKVLEDARGSLEGFLYVDRVYLETLKRIWR
jgi:hypothetical protein